MVARWGLFSKEVDHNIVAHLVPDGGPRVPCSECCSCPRTRKWPLLYGPLSWHSIITLLGISISECTNILVCFRTLNLITLILLPLHYRCQFCRQPLFLCPHARPRRWPNPRPLLCVRSPQAPQGARPSLPPGRSLQDGARSTRKPAAVPCHLSTQHQVPAMMTSTRSMTVLI